MELHETVRYHDQRLKSQEAMLMRLDQQLGAMAQELNELRQRSGQVLQQDGLSVETEPRAKVSPQDVVSAEAELAAKEPDGPLDVPVPDMDVVIELAIDHHEDYTFEESIWDAALLVFCSPVSVTDKCVLCLGVLINTVMQLFLVCVIGFDMLENPYGDGVVKQMLEWRVFDGHSMAKFDHVEGKSLATKLCARELWSFEQQSYDEMYAYLYKPIRGYWLSMLAIVCWVLTSMVEHRRCVEQMLTILNASPLKQGDSLKFIHGEGKFEIVGLRRRSKIMAMFLLVLPRFGVNLTLCVVGCVYMAQSPSLNEIILNAVALAFVVDIDESLFSVFLTDRLREFTKRIMPLTSTRPGVLIGTIPLKDLIRYLLTTGMIVFCVLFWLVPFNSAIEGAAMALCGGGHGFTFSGGEQSTPSVTLHPVGSYQQGCSEVQYRSYVRDYYATGIGEVRKNKTNDTYYRELIMKNVLNHAFVECPEGLILQPLRSDLAKVECVPVPGSLFDALPNGVAQGGVEYAECSRFNPSLGASACTPTEPEVCLWDWTSLQCEGASPGKLHSDACDDEYDYVECSVWEHTFNTTHPTKHCKAVFTCGGRDCLAMTGELRLTVDNGTDVMIHQEKASYAIVQAIAAVGDVSDFDVKVYAFGARSSLDEPPDSNLERTPMGDVIVAKYSISKIPVLFLPREFVLRGADTTMQANAALSTVAANFTVLSIEFADYQVYEDDDVDADYDKSRRLKRATLL